MLYESHAYRRAGLICAGVICFAFGSPGFATCAAIGDDPPAKSAQTEVKQPVASPHEAGSVPSLPDSRRHIRTAPLLLLSRADVRADLRLDARQIADAERAIAELHERAAALRGKSGPAAVAARRAIDEAQRQWIDLRLTPVQRGRLVELDLRWEGASSMVTRKPVGDALGLSQAQKDAISDALAERERRRPYSADADRHFEEVALKQLDAAQRKIWVELLGTDLAPQTAARPESTTVKE